ncbi:MAG: glycosyltransferase [Rubrivivax sp.]|nr:MAG: glycosyltransferase [Rubrivivax sp.]
MKNQLLRKISLWNRARLDKRRSAEISYPQWIKAHDTLTPATIKALADQVSKASFKPLITLILDVQAFVQPKGLRDTIQSVREQIYPHWELLIHHTGTANNVDLQELAGQDDRLTLINIPAGSSWIDGVNASVYNKAPGSFILRINPDGLLRKHALAMLVKAMAANAQGRVFYWDEDSIDGRGQRHAPLFKPKWNAHLLQAKNYLGQLCAIETQLWQQAGGLKANFSHAAMYDLLLRCTERLSDQAIVHIPFILYHAHSRHDADAQALQAGHQAVQAHLKRMGILATVTLEDGINRVDYDAPSMPPHVSIIIPSRDRPELLKKCVTTVLNVTTYAHFELLFIDNGTTNEEALQLIQEFARNPRFKLLVDKSPFNYSSLNNQGAAIATGDLLCMLNNDVEITDPRWLDKLVAVCVQDNVGVVGARLLLPSGQIQHAGVVLGIGGVAGHPFSYKRGNAPTYMNRAKIMHELSAVTGACLMTSKDVFERVGGLDEKLQVAFNDVDFCLRVRQLGKKVIYAPQVELIHHESASRGKDDTVEKKTRFATEIKYMQKKWPTWLNNDPAYNPNLTLKSDGFSLADPPRVNMLTELAHAG